MTTPPRDRLARILRGGMPTASSVGMTKRKSVLSLDVEGFGYVPLPVTRPKARMLIDLARPAVAVPGDETPADQVETPAGQAPRGTWEVPRHLVHAEWDSGVMRDILATAREELGMPSAAELTAELSSLRIYAPGEAGAAGHAAAPAGDSRQSGDVIGTLVVTLPSTHKGGELLVGDDEVRTVHEDPHPRDEWRTRLSSARGPELSAVAFRASCRHEISEVTSGYLIVLTYDLCLSGASALPDGDEGTVTELAALLREHFGAPAPLAHSGYATPRPSRLAFLLDGEHAPGGLSWDTLKGADASRVALLREAASRAGCETVLAVADIEVSHDVLELDGPRSPFDRDREYQPEREYFAGREYYEETGEYHGEASGSHERPGEYADHDNAYYRENCGDYADDPFRSDHADSEPRDEPLSLHTYEGDRFQVKELRWSSIRLTHWTGPDGVTLEETALPLPDDHVCAATPSGDLVPYKSELCRTGRLDRSYHRAAVVVWPRELGFANRAETNPARALEEITAKAASGDVPSARAMAGSLAVFWEAGPFYGSGWSLTAPGLDHWPGGLLGGTLRAAEAVADPEIAAMLLRPFSITDLTDSDAPLLAPPAGRYGPEWTAGVLRPWLGEDGRRPLDKQRRQEWTTERLPGLCAALSMAGDAGACVARQLLDLSWTRLSEDVEKSIAWSEKYRTAFNRLGESIAAVLEAAAAAGAPDTRDAVARHLRAQRDPVAALEVYAVCAAAAVTGAGASRQDGFRDLAADCAARLRSWLAPDPAEKPRGTYAGRGGPGPDRQGRTGKVIAEPVRTR